MTDVDYYRTVSQICSAALRSLEVSGNFQNAANTMTVWQESLKRLEAAEVAEKAAKAPVDPAKEPSAPAEPPQAPANGPSAG